MALVASSALLVDHLLGEPEKYHPLVGFGKLSKRVENQLNRCFFNPLQLRFCGFFSWSILVLPLPLSYFIFYQENTLFVLLDILVLYAAIGLDSLKKHAEAVQFPLSNGDIIIAQNAVGQIVSRETHQLTEQEISRATVESVLENGHDAAIASLFWYLIGGAPLVILHRLANTLDAMWGYRTKRHIYFGWFAAKADDYLGYFSAWISGLLYIFNQTIQYQRINRIIKTALYQRSQYKSLNGGWVMATGASVMEVKLGGKGCYDGIVLRSPELGQGRDVCWQDIPKSLNIVFRSSLLMLALMWGLGLMELLITWQG